jgi:hypothetical protein
MMKFVLALSLIVLGVLSRFLTHRYHLWNMAALGALSLYAGARLPRWLAAVVPVLAMVISDVVINRAMNAYLFSIQQLVSYSTLALIAVVGGVLARRPEPWTRAGLAIGSALLFFLTTNFAVWSWPHGMIDSTPTLYDRSLAGLAQCYVMGLPFLQNQVVAELVGVCVLFGVDALAQSVFGRWTRRELAASEAR